MRTARSIHKGELPREVLGTLRLDYDARQKSRLLGRLTNGVEVAIQLPRGTTLDGGDWLRTEEGAGVVLEAAPEPLSVARTADPLLLARVAYHLGNRHVALAVEPGRLAYRHDHVLDDLVRRFDVPVSFEEAPFRPEGGAYSGHHAHGTHEHGHAHGHSHEHAHEHHHHPPHEHEHEHEHDENGHVHVHVVGSGGEEK